VEFYPKLVESASLLQEIKHYITQTVLKIVYNSLIQPYLLNPQLGTCFKRNHSTFH